MNRRPQPEVEGVDIEGDAAGLDREFSGQGIYNFLGSTESAEPNGLVAEWRWAAHAG